MLGGGAGGTAAQAQQAAVAAQGSADERPDPCDIFWRRAELPVRLGGLGLVPREWLREPAYVGSHALTLRLQLAARKAETPSESGSGDGYDALRAALAGLAWRGIADLPTLQSMSDASSPAWQSKLTDKVYSEARARVLDALPKGNSFPDQAARAGVVAGASRGAGAWLMGELADSACRIPNDMFARLVAWRLGLPSLHFRAGAQCSCGVTLDPTLAHAFTCAQMQGYRSRRHTAQKKNMHKICSWAGVVTINEPTVADFLEPRPGVPPSALGKASTQRADVAYFDPDKPMKQATLVDIMVTGATKVSLKKYENAGAAAKAAEEDKRKKYQDWKDADARVKPFVMETHGALGGDARRLLLHWADTWGRRDEGLRTVAFMRLVGRVSVTLMRRVYEELRHLEAGHVVVPAGGAAAAVLGPYGHEDEETESEG